MPRRRCLAALCAAALAGLTPAGAGAARCPVQHWVGAWAASPSNPSAQALSDRTVRMIVSPHLGGTRARVHLSNRFGDAPLTVAHATIALAGDGGGLVGGTVRDLTFSGSRRVTIPPGGDLTSDPVGAAVAPFRRLAISVAVAGTVTRPTEHAVTREINYATASGTGDHAGDTGAGAFTASGSDGRSTGWYLLDGLDVLAPATTASVVAFGDSITDGFQGRLTPLTEDFATVGAEQRYPDYLQRRIRAAGLPLSVLDAGISGNRLLSDSLQPGAGPTGLGRLDADAIAQAGVSTVIVLEGSNDIGSALPGLLTPPQLIAGYQQVIARLHAAHLRVLLGTMTPTGGTIFPLYGLTADLVRLPVNAWIRGQRLSDGVVDFDAAVRDPADPSRIRSAYDGSDHAHYSAAGYERLAAAVPLEGLAAGTCPGPLGVRLSARRLVAGVPAALRVTVRRAGQPVAGARVRLGGATARTGRSGSATLRVRLRRPGVRRLVVSDGTTRRTLRIRVVRGASGA